jgi:hypothetical protein
MRMTIETCPKVVAEARAVVIADAVVKVVGRGVARTAVAVGKEARAGDRAGRVAGAEAARPAVGRAAPAGAKAVPVAGRVAPAEEWVARAAATVSGADLGGRLPRAGHPLPPPPDSRVLRCSVRTVTTSHRRPVHRRAMRHLRRRAPAGQSASRQCAGSERWPPGRIESRPQRELPEQQATAVA